MVSETHSDEHIIDNPIEIISPNGGFILRQFTPQDSEEIFALIDRNRDHLSQNGDDTASKYPTLEAVRKSIEHPNNPKRLRFAIRNKEGKFVGSINLTPDEQDPTQGEIGYYLGAEFQKQGYMGQSVSAMADYGFKILKYKSIYGDVTEGNIDSAKVLLKAGFKETSRHGDKIRYLKQKRSIIFHPARMM